MQRQPIREGRGIGEKLTELLVWAVIIAALVYGGRWYFVVYRNSPGVALKSYIGAMNAGNSEAQYAMLSSTTKQQINEDAYSKLPVAQGLSARVANYTIKNVVETGEKATANVTMQIRKTGQELYQAGSDSFDDNYLLRKETDGWKIVLEKCKITSASAVTPR